MAASRLENIASEIETKLAEIGMELVDTQYRKENQEQILRFLIDRDGGVTLDDCSEATRRLKDLIDNQEIYYDHLEVSSPGMDRLIKTNRDLLRFTGYKIKVKTVKAYAGPRTVIALLKGFSDEELTVETENGEILSIPRNMISIIRLQPEF
ncbi:MAG: ribosome maturation factor RimP [Syntrophomonadaceae bacterium]